MFIIVDSGSVCRNGVFNPTCYVHNTKGKIGMSSATIKYHTLPESSIKYHDTLPESTIKYRTLSESTIKYHTLSESLIIKCPPLPKSTIIYKYNTLYFIFPKKGFNNN